MGFTDFPVSCQALSPLTSCQPVTTWRPGTVVVSVAPSSSSNRGILAPFSMREAFWKGGADVAWLVGKLVKADENTPMRG